MVYYTIKLLVIKKQKKSQVLWGKPCRSQLARYADPGEYGLESHTCPLFWTKRMEISGLEYGKIWGNWENLQETLWFSLLIIFLNVFFLLSLLLDGKNPLKIRFCHRKRRNITQKNRGFRRTADPYLRITHFG